MANKPLRLNANSFVISLHEILGKSLVKQLNSDGVNQLFFPIALAFPIKECYPKFSNTSRNSFTRVSCWVILFGFILLLGEVFLYINDTF